MYPSVGQIVLAIGFVALIYLCGAIPWYFVGRLHGHLLKKKNNFKLNNSVAANLSQLVKTQRDIPPEFLDAIEKHFWDLVN